MSEIHLENITVAYGNVKALDNFSLRIKDGSFISLLGPSGCGKTTCLRTVAGFIRPDRGNVYIDGKRVNDLPPNKRKIGIVFQNYALFPHKTVFQNVAFGLRMQKAEKCEIRDRVDEILKMLYLSGFEGRYPIQLSGGQQQRVALARALVTKPSVLLLDEPLGALDKKLREEMQIELRKLQERLGITTLFVTHDQEEALTMADTIVIMNEGKTEQLGTPGQIYDRPENKFVAEFIGLSNFLSLDITEVDGEDMICALDGNILRIPKDLHRENISGGCVDVAIRPEKIAMARDMKYEPEIHCIPGMIERIVYKGSFTLYYVRVAEKLSIVVQRISGEAECQNYTLEDRICVCWNKRDILVLGP